MIEIEKGIHLPKMTRNEFRNINLFFHNKFQYRKEIIEYSTENVDKIIKYTNFSQTKKEYEVRHAANTAKLPGNLSKWTK